MRNLKLTILIVLLLVISFTLPSLAKKTKIRNEFGETVQVRLKHLKSKDEEMGLYLNAYELIDLGNLDKGVYVASVYNLSNSFLGFIKYDSSESKKSILSINRFDLVQHLNGITEELPKLSIKDESSINTGEVKTSSELEKVSTESIDIKGEDVLLEQELLSHNDVNAAKKEELEEDSDQIEQLVIEKKKIKVANISNVAVHIDIIEPGKDPMGNGWTIDNDIYVPQYLLIDAEPIEISSKADLILKSNNGNVLKKHSADLKVDEKGDYILVINEQP